MFMKLTSCFASIHEYRCESLQQGRRFDFAPELHTYVCVGRVTIICPNHIAGVGASTVMKYWLRPLCTV